jgi:hypothetical protein
MQTQYPETHEYTITRVSAIASCSPFIATYRTVHDAPNADRSYSWEFFSEKDMPLHFKRSVQILEKSIKDLSNTSIPFKKNSQKQLEFMLQSCMHSRTLLDSLK